MPKSHKGWKPIKTLGYTRLKPQWPWPYSLKYPK